MERRLAVHAGTHRNALNALVVAVLVATLPLSNAVAAPKSADAKAAFDRGVSAYQKGDYDGASAALGKSFALEPDVETLFAWAQTERQLVHCDKAIALYQKLLTYDLPAENKAAIRTKLDECKTIIAQTRPDPIRAEPTTAKPPSEPNHTESAVGVEQPETPTPGRPRWKDPIGGSLVVLGVVGVGVGVSMLVSASGANSDKDAAATYGEFQALEDKANSRGKLGVVSATAGGVLIGAGIVWYVTRGLRERKTQVTGWLSPSGGGGGVAALGRF